MATVKRYYEVDKTSIQAGVSLEILTPFEVDTRIGVGCTLTPLLLATAERVSALDSLLVTIGHDAGLTREIAVLEAMLEEMKGATDAL